MFLLVYIYILSVRSPQNIFFILIKYDIIILIDYIKKEPSLHIIYWGIKMKKKKLLQYLFSLLSFSSNSFHLH